MQNVNIVAPKVSRGIGTALVQVGGYTPVAGTGAIVSSLIVANTSSALLLITVTLYDGTNDTNLAVQAPVGVGDALVLGGENMKITFVNGWFIRVKSNIAGSCDASLCVSEFT